MSKGSGGTFTAIVAVAALLFLCGGTVATNSNDKVITCTVVDKDRGATSKGQSNYRVYTEQCGVLSNDDQWLAAKTDSADVWAQIQTGHTYRFRVIGVRFSPLSWMPNIIEVQGEVPRPERG